MTHEKSICLGGLWQHLLSGDVGGHDIKFRHLSCLGLPGWSYLSWVLASSSDLCHLLPCWHLWLTLMELDVWCDLQPNALVWGGCGHARKAFCSGAGFRVVHACWVASVVSDTLGPQWIVARQSPLSIGFPRQEYWSWLPCLPPGDLPDPGIKLVCLTSSASTPPGSHMYVNCV